MPKFDLSPLEAAEELCRRVKFGDFRHTAQFVVWYVEDLLDEGRVDDISQFIGLVPPSIEIYSATAILRSSYVVGHTIPGWLRFLADVRIAHKDNPRIDRILVGLDRPYNSR